MARAEKRQDESHSAAGYWKYLRAVEHGGHLRATPLL